MTEMYCNAILWHNVLVILKIMIKNPQIHTLYNYTLIYTPAY